jgi:3-oxoacyl-[acyl-carrier protein] reductase
MPDFSGKVAIVTGSNRGIGRGIAKRLAADGASVVLCARDAKLLGHVQAEIAAAGGTAEAIALDLRTVEAPPALVAYAIEKFGRIDLIVNNAGATKRADFLELTEEDWQDGFALKFFGAVRLTRAAWPYLKAIHGSLINIGGSGGRTPGPEFTIGGSVNSAVLAFTKAMADVGVRDGVQVNAINPGLIRTDRYQKRLEALAAQKGIDLAAAEKELVTASKTTRVGEPEDIAALVAFIASPEGRLLQGSLIDMDAGATKTL